MEIWYGVNAVLLRAASESAFHVSYYSGIHIGQDLFLDILGNSVVLHPVFLQCHIDIALLKFQTAKYYYIVLDGGNYDFLCVRRWIQVVGAPLIGEFTAVGVFDSGISKAYQWLTVHLLISSLTRNTKVVLTFIKPASLRLTGHKAGCAVLFIASIAARVPSPFFALPLVSVSSTLQSLHLQGTNDERLPISPLFSNCASKGIHSALVEDRASYCNISSELRLRGAAYFSQGAVFSLLIIVFLAMDANEGHSMWVHQTISFSLDFQSFSGPRKHYNIISTVEFVVTIAVTLETAILLQYSEIQVCFLFVFYQHNPLCRTLFLWHLACIANLAITDPNHGSTVEVYNVYFYRNTFWSANSQISVLVVPSLLWSQLTFSLHFAFYLNAICCSLLLHNSDPSVAFLWIIAWLVALVIWSSWYCYLLVIPGEHFGHVSVLFLPQFGNIMYQLLVTRWTQLLLTYKAEEKEEVVPHITATTHPLLQFARVPCLE